MRSYLFLPIQLFFFLFAIDKLFLISWIHQLLVKQEANAYTSVAKFENQKYEERKKYWLKEIGENLEDLEKRAIVFIGTSRAEGFGEITKEHIQSNPFVKDEAKVLQIPVASRIIKAGTFMHLYMLYEGLLETYPNIKKIALEINYASFNKKSNVRQKKEITDLSWSQFLELFPYLSYRDIVEYLSSNVFVLNKMQVKWKYLLQKDEIQSKDLAENLFLLQKILQNSKRSNIIDGVKENEESAERIYAYKEHIKHDSNLLFTNFDLNPTELALLKKIIEEAKHRQIDLVLYKPKIHGLYRELTAKYISAEHKFFSELEKLCQANSVKFINLDEKDVIQCNYFSDPSHISKYCMPEIIEKIYNL